MTMFFLGFAFALNLANRIARKQVQS